MTTKAELKKRITNIQSELLAIATEVRALPRHVVPEKKEVEELIGWLMGARSKLQDALADLRTMKFNK